MHLVVHDRIKCTTLRGRSPMWQTEEIKFALSKPLHECKRNFINRERWRDIVMRLTSERYSMTTTTALSRLLRNRRVLRAPHIISTYCIDEHQITNHDREAYYSIGLVSRYSSFYFTKLFSVSWNSFNNPTFTLTVFLNTKIHKLFVPRISPLRCDQLISELQNSQLLLSFVL